MVHTSKVENDISDYYRPERDIFPRKLRQACQGDGNKNERVRNLFVFLSQKMTPL